MTATRAPVLGIAIAALVLLAETLGLFAYQHHQRTVAADRAAEAKALQVRAQAIAAALEAKAKLDALMAELDRLDEELRQMPIPRCSSGAKERARILRQLQQLRRERRELDDTLIVPPPRVPR